MLVALELILAASVPNITLNDLVRVSLGDSQQVATSKLSGVGQVSVVKNKDGSSTLKSDNIDVTICHGIVVHASRTSDEKPFHNFAALAKEISDEYGPAMPADIFGLSHRPAKADASDASDEPYVDVVRVSWEKLPKFYLGYSEIGGKKQVVAAVNDPNPCTTQ